LPITVSALSSIISAKETYKQIDSQADMAGMAGRHCRQAKHAGREGGHGRNERQRGTAFRQRDEQIQLTLLK
jgi:hypothetical protein